MSPAQYTHLLLVDSVQCDRSPSCVTITGQLRSPPELQGSSSLYLVSPSLPKAWHCSSFHRPTALGKNWSLGTGGLVTLSPAERQPCLCGCPRRRWFQRCARGVSWCGAYCWKSAWHANPFALGKTGTPWSTDRVGGGTPMRCCTRGSAQSEYLIFLRYSVGEGGAGGGELVRKKPACVFCVHVQAGVDSHEADNRITERLLMARCFLVLS